MRRYSKVRGITRMCGGFVLGDSRAHTLSHSAVSDPSLSPWAQNLVRKRAQHLAATSIKSKPPSSVRRCKVDRGTLKIASRHIYQGTAVGELLLVLLRGRENLCYVPRWGTLTVASWLRPANRFFDPQT